MLNYRPVSMKLVLGDPSLGISSGQKSSITVFGLVTAGFMGAALVTPKKYSTTKKVLWGGVVASGLAGIVAVVIGK